MGLHHRQLAVVLSLPDHRDVVDLSERLGRIAVSGPHLLHHRWLGLLRALVAVRHEHDSFADRLGRTPARGRPGFARTAGSPRPAAPPTRRRRHNLAGAYESAGRLARVSGCSAATTRTP